MSKRLSRAQREAIIIDFLNGKDTPGYHVIEGTNGKFTVRSIKEEPKLQFEIEHKAKDLVEEEDINEKEFEHSETNLTKAKQSMSEANKLLSL